MPPALATRSSEFDHPPALLNAEGRPRTVGVELEFAGLPALEAAKHLGSALGGVVRQLDPHAYRVTGTDLGDLHVELDSRYVHPGQVADGVLGVIVPKLASLFSAATSAIVPCEVVTGPLPFDDLPKVERLVDALRKAGARGTQDGALYAFGLHFNPETPSTEAGPILRILQSFVLLNAWLRRDAAPDPTRNLFGFADPFPDPYVRRIVAPDYRPDLGALIDDYVIANPTRNRDCDLLPLFLHLDEARVRRALPEEKIGKRPTFHYRLPDARVSDPGWSIAPDWNRWVAVERVASDGDRLGALAAAYLGFKGEPKSWADLSARIAFS